MALKFSTTKEIAQVSGVKVLIYGRAGSGKTRLCATAPKPIIFSAEAGLLSLRKHDIPVVEIKTIEDLEEAYEWASSSKAAAKFSTICLDSISEMGEVVLTNAKIKAKDPRQAYGELIEKMQIVIKQFRDLKGKNVYFTAKELRIKDEKAGTVNYEPEMPGAKLGRAIPYYFDEVFHLGIAEDNDGKKYRYLRTSADFQYDAKDRSGSLDELEKPDLTHIFNKIIKDEA